MSVMIFAIQGIAQNQHQVDTSKCHMNCTGTHLIFNGEESQIINLDTIDMCNEKTNYEFRFYEFGRNISCEFNHLIIGILSDKHRMVKFDLNPLTADDGSFIDVGGLNDAELLINSCHSDHASSHYYTRAEPPMELIQNIPIHQWATKGVREIDAKSNTHTNIKYVVLVCRDGNQV